MFFESWQRLCEKVGVKVRGLIHAGCGPFTARDLLTNVMKLTDDQVLYIDALPQLIEERKNASVIEEKSNGSDAKPAFVCCLLSNESKQQRTLYIIDQLTSMYELTSETKTDFHISDDNVVAKQVQTLKLDDVIAVEARQHINALYVTTNGSEKEVLEGASALLRDACDYVVVRAYDNQLFVKDAALVGLQEWNDFFAQFDMYCVMGAPINESKMTNLLYAKKAIAWSIAKDAAEAKDARETTELTDEDWSKYGGKME